MVSHALSAHVEPGDWAGTHLSVYLAVDYPDGTRRYVVTTGGGSVEIRDEASPLRDDFIVPDAPDVLSDNTA